MIELKPWTLPLIVAAIVVPVVSGFLLGGPPVGLAAGALIGATVLVVAARQSPRGTLETAKARDFRRHVLVVVHRELDDPGAIERIKREGDLDAVGEEAELLILAPAESGLLDRWATDVKAARAEAQRKLVVSVASLAKAGIHAEAAVGDPDVVQAVEDQLRRFPATEVILVTGPLDEDSDGRRAAAELTERLQQPLLQVVLGSERDPSNV